MTPDSHAPSLAGIAADRTRLQVEFPGWRIWLSSANRWWATWGKELTEEQGDAGCSRTLDADTAKDLRELLVEQKARRELATP